MVNVMSRAEFAEWFMVEGGELPSDDRCLRNQRLSAVNASMLMAGCELTPVMEADVLDVLYGRVSADDIVAGLLEDFHPAVSPRPLIEAHNANRSPLPNSLGLTDPDEVETLAVRVAAVRIAECENRLELSEFSVRSLCGLHNYLVGEVYPWAGQFRTGEVGAMGLLLCRADYVSTEMNNLFHDFIGEPLPSRPSEYADIREAAPEVAELVARQWGELTLVHPFIDGNSRLQRLFFDQMLRQSGWVLDWERINPLACHAGRYVVVATGDSKPLAKQLLRGLTPIKMIPEASPLPRDPYLGLSAPEIMSRMLEDGL